MPTIISGDTGVNQITDGAIQAADFATGVGPVFTKEYVSAEQTITAGGLLTLAHGLGAVPKFITAELVCKTAEVNYSIGDVVCISIGTQSSSAQDGLGVGIKKDSTNLVVRYGSFANTFNIVNATTGAVANITNANWRLVVRAWA